MAALFPWPTISHGQLLLSDLREIQAKTANVAVEELMLAAIEQVASIRRLLGRLSKQR